MSCEECRKIQKQNLAGKNVAFLRIGIANVLIGACDKHFNKLQEQIGIKPSVVFRLKNVKFVGGKYD